MTNICNFCFGKEKDSEIVIVKIEKENILPTLYANERETDITE